MAYVAVRTPKAWILAYLTFLLVGNLWVLIQGKYFPQTDVRRVVDIYTQAPKYTYHFPSQGVSFLTGPPNNPWKQWSARMLFLFSPLLTYTVENLHLVTVVIVGFYFILTKMLIYWPISCRCHFYYTLMHSVPSQEKVRNKKKQSLRYEFNCWDKPAIIRGKMNYSKNSNSSNNHAILRTGIKRISTS